MTQSNRIFPSIFNDKSPLINLIMAYGIALSLLQSDPFQEKIVHFGYCAGLMHAASVEPEIEWGGVPKVLSTSVYER